MNHDGVADTDIPTFRDAADDGRYETLLGGLVVGIAEYHALMANEG